MAHPTTPHTETQQNTNPGRPDLKPDQTEQTEGTRGSADFDRIHEGEQAGTVRAPQNFPDASGKSRIAPSDAAYEGSTSTRTPKGAAQGITGHSSDEESQRQEKVVKDRPDAQAGVNHSRSS